MAFKYINCNLCKLYIHQKNKNRDKIKITYVVPTVHVFLYRNCSKYSQRIG